MTYNAKDELYSFVARLRKQLNITEYPINTINICSNFGIADVIKHNFKTFGMCAAAMSGEKKNTIILNSCRSESEQNFDCGHEIIHLTKHQHTKIEIFNCFSSTKPTQNEFLEWESNEGAAELIVPFYVLIHKIEEYDVDTKDGSNIFEFKQKVSRFFNVSMSVIELRLENLKYEIDQYLNGVPIEYICFLSKSQQYQQGIIVQSLNDLEKQYYHSKYLDDFFDYIPEESENDIVSHGFFGYSSKMHENEIAKQKYQHNLMMIEKWHDKWLDPDYKF